MDLSEINLNRVFKKTKTVLFWRDKIRASGIMLPSCGRIDTSHRGSCTTATHACHLTDWLSFPEDRLTWGDLTERELTRMVPQVFSYQHSYQISQKKKHSEWLQRLIFHNTTPTHVRSSQCSSTNCHPYSHPGTEYVIPSFTMKIHCYMHEWRNS